MIPYQERLVGRAGPVTTRESWGAELIVSLELPRDRALAALRAVEAGGFRRSWECLGEQGEDTGFYEIGETAVMIGWIGGDWAGAIGPSWGLSVCTEKPYASPLDYTCETDQLSLDQRLQIAAAFRTILALEAAPVCRS